MIVEKSDTDICLGVSHSFTPALPWVRQDALQRAQLAQVLKGFKTFCTIFFSCVNEWLSIFWDIFSSLSHDPRIQKQGPNNRLEVWLTGGGSEVPREQ